MHNFQKWSNKVLLDLTWLDLVTITEARNVRDLKPTFYYTLTERPHNLWSVTKRPSIFSVAPVTERLLCLRCLMALVCYSDIWVPPGLYIVNCYEMYCFMWQHLKPDVIQNICILFACSILSRHMWKPICAGKNHFLSKLYPQIHTIRPTMIVLAIVR